MKTKIPAKPDLHAVRRWLHVGLALVLLMLVVGAITRLTESGLSITEWKPVTGVLPPLNEAQWQEEFKKYQASPEFRYKNMTFTLTDFKTIYWWEWVHRLLARLVGLVYIIPLTIFLWRRSIPGAYLPGILLIGVLGGLQGFLGWYMVKSGLVDEPRVSHYRLAAHLLTALTIAATIYWQSLRLSNFYNSRFQVQTAIRRHAILALLVLIIQIVYGAFVAGKDAGQLYNTWPRMGSEWIPEAVFASTPWYLNFLENEAGLQFIHRTLAWVVFLVMITLSFRLIFGKPAFLLWREGLWLLTLVVLQIVLGIFTLLMAVPIVLGVLHQLVAAWLLLVVVRIIFLTRKMSASAG
ncbi:MAG: COX15/CtaA family protein [Flavobacteriales bacterium]|nr:COX15/CtaA family protein [Flavobacteriales bacterium]